MLKLTSAVAASALIVSIVGCGGGGSSSNDTNDTSGGGSGIQTPASKSTQTAFNAVGAGIGSALQAGNTDPSARSISNFVFDCETGGSGSLSGDVTINQDTQTQGGTFMMDIDMILNECDGSTGELDFIADGSFTQNSISFSALVNGALADDCVTDFTGLRMALQGDETGENVSGSVSGSVITTCADGSASCQYDNVNIRDEVTLQNSCSLL